MEIEMHRCPKCTYEFEWQFQVDHHVRREHTNVYAAELFHAIVELEQFSCTCCGFRAYHNWDLYEHCKRQHRRRVDVNDMEKSLFCNDKPEVKPDMYSCNLCRYKSDSSLCLVKHTASCEAMMTARTVDNNDVSSTSRRSNVGALEKKTKEAPGGTTIDWFQCTKCPYRAKRKATLKRHMLTHASSEDIDWFQCAKCSYKAKLNLHLQRHLLTHAASEDIEWFQCTKCSYKAKQNLHLQRHMLTHAASEDVEWFQCTECSFKAKRKSSLKRHMLTHASSKDIDWFQCAKCSYKAKRISGLKQHNMLTHASSEDVHWFQCAKCSYKAKLKLYLKQHVLTHAPSEDIDWYQCAKCSYKAKQKSSLNRHMLTHAKTSIGFNVQSVHIRPNKNRN